MIGKLDNLDKVLIWRHAGNNKTLLGQNLLECAVELIAVPVPFGNRVALITPVGQRPGRQVRGIRAQSHGAANGVHTEQIPQFINDRMWSIRLKLRTVGIAQTANVTRVFNDGALHTEANPEVRNLFFASKLDGPDHAGNAALSEASRNQNAVEG